MRRFFLSGQTTCAMLLGAGLLLRAQAALTKVESAQQQPSLEVPQSPAELYGERAPRVALNERHGSVRIPNTEYEISHTKYSAQKSELHKTHACGVALASHSFRCG